MTTILAHRLSRLYLTSAAVVPTDHELITLRRWIRSEFGQIGAPVCFQDADLDLPQTEALFAADGILRISTAHNAHPWLSFDENAQFRAVHDWHHLQTGANSTLPGEHATFMHARKCAPRAIHWMLFSEIVLQAAACIATGAFAPQKLVHVFGGLA